MLTKAPFLGFFWRFARSLRFPQLFVLAAGLFLVDLWIPDLLPFADEILLGLATLLLGSWRKERRFDDDDERPSNESEASDDKVIDI